MRRIGRLRNEASPSKAAVTPWPPTTPIINREPVPALPKSNVSCGERIEPTPSPLIRHRPSPSRSSRAPSALQASPVRKTSSPSSKPLISVVPLVKRPKIKARCEIDLSPGGRTRPFRAPAREDVSGLGKSFEECDKSTAFQERARKVQKRSYHSRPPLSTRAPGRAKDQNKAH